MWPYLYLACLAGRINIEDRENEAHKPRVQHLVHGLKRCAHRNSRVGQNHIYARVYGVYTVILAGDLP